MALVFSHYEASITLGGIDDSFTTRNYRLRGANATDAGTNVTDILAALANVSDGVVKGYKLSAVTVEDAYNRPSVATAERGDALIMTGEIDGDPLKKYTFSIPYPKSTLFLASAGENYNVADISDAALIAYKDLFSAGATNAAATISDGEDAGNLIRGKRA